MKDDHDQRLGGAFALGAFVFWGFVPLYYPFVDHIAPQEMLVHRVLWTALGLVPFLIGLGLAGGLRQVFATPRALLMLTVTAALIGFNWFVFMWAMTHAHVIEVSMGYFINPLVNVFLGVVLLGERLRKTQIASVAVAATGVALLVYNVGALPWVALALPMAFGAYGLLRKHVTTDTFTSLFVEMVVLAPFALAYWAYLATQGTSNFINEGTGMKLWLFLLGPITILPLTLFGAAAKRITLTALGFFQYIAPSITFLIGVYVFREPFDRVQLLTFAFIWASLIIFSIDGVLESRRLNALAAEA